GAARLPPADRRRAASVDPDHPGEREGHHVAALRAGAGRKREDPGPSPRSDETVAPRRRSRPRAELVRRSRRDARGLGRDSGRRRLDAEGTVAAVDAQSMDRQCPCAGSRRHSGRRRVLQRCAGRDREGGSVKRIAAVAVLMFGCASAADPGAGARKPPNFLIILADDLGFSDIGCYGGEISTPNLDGLAAGALRFTQFYNTARCWPTRSALLSGYYAPQIRMDPPKGRLPQFAKLLPHELRPAGYRSYHSGKWHVNGAPKILADGGFDRSYDMTDQNRYFSPQTTREDDRTLPPVARDSGYYATTAIADHAIKCLKEHAEKHSGSPFFSYLAFISPHFPLHALKEDIDLDRDKYLEGWDVVRERSEEH